VARGRDVILGAHQALQGEAAESHATLDSLFRRAAVRGVDAIALADAPNRESFTDGAPRRLTYAQADRAISATAAKLRQLGLPTDAVVAMQLPNTVESVIVLLGILRAGMIAAPLPLLWRRQDILTALRPLGAKAIITASRIGSVRHAEIAMQVAAELFPVRYVCGFGNDLPDGMVPLDGLFALATRDVGPPPARSSDAAAHVAVVTFDDDGAGICAVARNQQELIAGGLGPYLESGAPRDGNLLSAIPPASFAGLSLTLLPWLLGGGALNLHHAFDPNIFDKQASEQDGGTVVIPGPALAALTEANCLGRPANIVALWRSPERLTNTSPWRGEAALSDAASFGEIGLIASRRSADGLPAAIPAGLIGAPRGSPTAITVAETARSARGTLLLRGPMVPVQAFPPGAEDGSEPHIDVGVAGFVDARLTCRRDGDILTLTAPPAGMTCIGGYRFSQGAVDLAVASVDPDATIVALPDAVLGQRLAGNAKHQADIIAELQSRGVNPLIAGAFRPRAHPNAA
jgi:hypothetical protein